jgi:PncC family amidohydrolase
MADDAAIGLAQRLQEASLAKGLTVATAESCTGGLVAAALTAVPGSSGYVRGGVVAYADAVKMAALDVPPAVLEEHGAVSEETALAMAEGARRRLGVDLAVAVTGVAGPDGGSATKPVGLTWIAVAGPAGASAERRLWPGDRDANRRDSVLVAIEALLAAAERLPPRP